MKKFIVLASAAAALVSAPAMAQGEGRIELRSGLAFGGGVEKVFLGGGAGYDIDLGEKAFVGLDLGADKVLTSGSKVLWSIGGRVGAKLDEKSKLYAAAGVGLCCGTSDIYAGAGYQRDIAEKVYIKAEYRRQFANGSDGNFVGLGLGVKF